MRRHCKTLSFTAVFAFLCFPPRHFDVSIFFGMDITEGRARLSQMPPRHFDGSILAMDYYVAPAVFESQMPPRHFDVSIRYLAFITGGISIDGSQMPPRHFDVSI